MPCTVCVRTSIGRLAILLGVLVVPAWSAPAPRVDGPQRTLPAARDAVPASATIAVGTSAPKLDLPGRDGKPVTLAEFAGKVVYVYFWSSWTPTCQQDLPVLNGLQARYAAQGLQILGVGVDLHREDADSFLDDHPAEFVLAFDASSKAPRDYGVVAMPAGILIGRDGRVLQVLGGVKVDRQAELESSIQAALKAPATR